MNPGETKKFELKSKKCRIAYRWHRGLRRYRFVAYVGRYPLDEFGFGYRTEQDAQKAIESCIRNLDYSESEEFLAELDRRPNEEGPSYTWEEVRQHMQDMQTRFTELLAEILPRHPRIVADPKVLGGCYTIRGTRMPVSLVMRSIKEEGMSHEQIRDEYELTADDIEVALKFREDLAKTREAEETRERPVKKRRRPPARKRKKSLTLISLL
jgi:uncharacterized protein (DUF433 family)